MQLNFRKFPACVLFILSALIFTNAQTEIANKTADDNPPSSADVMRSRISKAKAHIVVKNYNAAIYELENIKRETSDQALDSVANVLLMHCYLEQTDYKRVQEFLGKFYKDMKANNAFARTNYYAVAGQIVKGARTQLERYRGIGLSVADRNLPLEALVDIEKMRETLEIVVTHSKELGADKKQDAQAMPLMEEAMNARVALAKDEYDANRWKREVADAREMLVDSRSTVINATDGEPVIEAGSAPAANNSAANNSTANNSAAVKTASLNLPAETEIAASGTDDSETVAAFKPVNENETNRSKSATPEMPKEIPANQPEQTAETVAENNAPAKNKRSRIVIGNKPTEEEKKKEEPKPSDTTAQNDNSGETKTAVAGSPMEVGSLVEFATKQVKPVYPAMARNIRQVGVVKIEFVVDENGKVAEISNASGPSMLQRAATDALKKWQFKPFMRDGVAVKAVGFVNFNFNL